MDEIEQLKEEEKQNELGEDKGGKGSWIIGVVVILIGIYFLLGNLTGFTLNNWWAFFILIPALGSFANAYRSYQAEGRLTKESRGSIMGGLILTFIASAFLFELDWSNIWPVFIILAGIGMLLSVVLDN